MHDSGWATRPHLYMFSAFSSACFLALALSMWSSPCNTQHVSCVCVWCIGTMSSVTHLGLHQFVDLSSCNACRNLLEQGV